MGTPEGKILIVDIVYQIKLETIEKYEIWNFENRF